MHAEEYPLRNAHLNSRSAINNSQLSIDEDYVEKGLVLS